jgi:predicted PurR-regulated permease PerM
MPATPWMSGNARRHRTVRISTRTIVLAVGVVLALLALRGAFVAGQRILGWAAACTVTAVFVAPLVTWLGRWIPRVAAVILTFVVVAVAAGALVFGTFDNLDREVRSLQRAAPDATEELERRDDEIGSAMRDLELSARVENFLEVLDDRVGTGSDALAENALTIPVFFVNAILTIFLLIYGAGIVEGGLGLIDDDERRARTRRVLMSATLRARRTFAAMLGQGIVVGLAVGLVAAALSLPAPVVLGLVAGVAATLPDVGILLGVLPTVALTGGLHSGRAAVAILAAAMVLQAMEALHIRHWVDRWGTEVGPSVVWIVVLLGYTLHGIGMAFFGVAFAVFALAVIDQVPRERPPVEDADVGEPVPT